MAIQAVSKTIKKTVNTVRQAVPKNEKWEIKFAPFYQKQNWILVRKDLKEVLSLPK